MIRWTIQEDQSGVVTLYKGRKRLGAHSSVEAAQRKAEKEMAEGDLLYHAAPDGYETHVKGKRRGWRQ